MDYPYFPQNTLWARRAWATNFAVFVFLVSVPEIAGHSITPHAVSANLSKPLVGFVDEGATGWRASNEITPDSSSSAPGDKPTSAEQLFAAPSSIAAISASVGSSLPGSVGSAGGTWQWVVCDSPGCTWTSSSDASWITVSPASGKAGDSVTVSVVQNKGPGPRTGTITIANGKIDVSQAAPIGCGQSISWSITDPSPYGGSVAALYDFVGKAGEKVLLNVHTSASASGTGANAFLFGPDGLQLGIAWDGGFGPSSNPILLSQTGTYLIGVLASGPGTTTFDMSLMIIGGEGCARFITCGQTQNGRIDPASKLEAYTFFAEAKEAVLASRGMIIDPNGSLLGSAYPDRIFQLATTGTYTIVVNYSGAGSLSIGQTQGFSYDLTLQFTTGRCAPRINCGETAGGDIGPLKSDLDAWKFDANANERIVLYSSMIATTSGYFYPQWDLYDPQGNLFTSLASGRETPEYSIALPLTGTYTIIVKAQQQAGTGSYDIGLQFTSGRCASPITCGQTVRGSVRTRTELDAYQFPGTAGEAVIFPVYGVDANLPGDSSKVVGLFSPKGEYLTYNSWSGFALPESGNYVIIVGAKDRNGTGDYDLALQHTTGRCAATITCGQTLNREISSRHQLDAYKFSGTAGKEVSLWPEEEPLSLYTNVDVFSTAGNFLGNANNPKGFFTPSISGTLIAVVSHSDDRINGYRFFLGCEGVCTFFLAEVKTFFPASGGVGSALVVTGVEPNRTDGCCWTSSSGVSWIRFVSGASRCTTWSPAWEVDPNAGPQRTGTLTIAGQSFVVTQAGPGSCPAISSISPAVAAEGTTVTLNGTNLSGVTAIKFSNNIPATSFTIVSSTQITARVPGGARTGPITISSSGCSDLQTGPFGITQITLYFPRLVTTDGSGKAGIDDSEYTGIGLVNLDSSDGILALTAFDKTGIQITGTDITNPAAQTLKKGAQLAAVDFQVFGAGLPAIKPVGWMKLESSVSKLVGFFLTFNATLGIQDGAEVSFGTLTSFILPEIEDQGITQIHVANPDPTAFSLLTFNLIKSDGTQRVPAVNRSINGSGAVAEFFTDLFPGVTPVGSEYIRVSSSSTAGVVPFEYLGKTGLYVEGLNGQDATGGATTLYCPQYVVGPGYRTTLSVVNLDSTAGTVTFKFIRDDGTQAGTTQQVAIAARGKVYITDQKFFLDPGNVLASGYLEITSSGPKLAGSVVFGDLERTTFSAALPLVSTLRTSMIFSQVASNTAYFTGIAALNPNPNDANATLEVFDRNGLLLQTRSLVIKSRQRISQVLTQYFPNLIGQDISSGYIKFMVDGGVASFAVLGTNNLSVLSAIPPQVVP